jgi:hypothetical protein
MSDDEKDSSTLIRLPKRMVREDHREHIHVFSGDLSLNKKDWDTHSIGKVITLREHWKNVLKNVE